MFGFVSVVGLVGLLATASMTAAMLYFVWLSLGDGTHAPDPDDQPELDDEENDSQPEVTDGSTA